MWATTTIRDVCEPTEQRDPRRGPSGEFHYVDIAGIDRAHKTIANYQTLSCADAPSRARMVIRKNDTLVSTVRPNLNAVAMVPAHLDGHIASTGFCVLRPRSVAIESRYLFYSTLTRDFVAALTARVKGANYPAVSDNDVKETEIPLPPLSEQRRIVALLDQAARLRRLRAKVDTTTHRILPALFFKMFGDPAVNPMGWPCRPLSDLAVRFSDGPFGSNLKTSHYTADGVRVLRLQNVGVGILLDDDKAFISPDYFVSLRKHECLPGDVIVATLGDPNLRAFVLPSHVRLALNKADCVQIRPKPDVAVAEYICWLLNAPGTMRMAQRLMHGQTRTRISMGLLRNLSVPVPEYEVQARFAAHAQAATLARAMRKRANENATMLWTVLLHAAFTGQLTASWSKAHMAELLQEMEQQASALAQTVSVP